MNTSKPASFTDIAFETGVIAERERIIKLLEEAEKNLEYDDYIAGASIDLQYAISLIKGEQK